jgi:hypothetical protein
MVRRGCLWNSDGLRENLVGDGRVSYAVSYDDEDESVESGDRNSWSDGIVK